MLMDDFWKVPKDGGGGGTGYWRSQTGDQKVETLIPPTPGQMANDFIIRVSVMKPP